MIHATKISYNSAVMIKGNSMAFILIMPIYVQDHHVHEGENGGLPDSPS